MPRTGLLFVYIAIAVLLVGGMLLAWRLAEPGELRVRAAAIEALPPPLGIFVERERGLQLTRPLKVTVLGGPEFEAALEESASPDTAEIGTAQALFGALGLLPPGLDLARLVTAADRNGVVGFSSSEEQELVVRDGDPTPLVRRTIVHELTHALDDQHFGLQREFDSDEAATGGDFADRGQRAVRIERSYVRSLAASRKREIPRLEEAQLALRGDVPPLVELSLGFPYVYGPELVEQVLRHGGRARLDAAFSSPPVSSGQVLDLSRYLQGDRPLTVQRPTADCPRFDEGEIGQLLPTCSSRN